MYVFKSVNMTEKICRLCLQTICKNYETIQESLLKTLNLNLNLTKENLTCTECANYLKVFSNFKTAGVYRRDGILPLPDLECDVKFDVIKTETINDPKSLAETERNCDFCAKTGEKQGLVSLNKSNKYELVVNMLRRHIPEINLNNTVATCEACLDALRGVASFILKCLEVEEEINKYINTEGADVKAQIDLQDVKQFRCRSMLKLEMESIVVNKLEDGRCDDIKKEFATTGETEVKREVEIYHQELAIKTEFVNIKSEQSDFDSCQEPSIRNKIAGDPLEMLEMGLEKNINQHLLTHKIPSEITVFKCTVCPYEAKYKHHLKLHLLIHRNPSEVNMLKCEMCSYETYHKSNLNRHLLTHKSPSEVKMFECETCSFNTKRKSDLKRHLLTHQKSSEVNTFKCAICPYEAKQKGHLKYHLLTHRSPIEISMLKCEICPYETKHKYSLTVHLLTHKSPTEINMFKCEICMYKTKHKSSLRNHLLIHKNPSEIEIFKCELCLFEAKRIDNLYQHLLTHRSYPEVKTFKCETCLYETIHEESLTSHILTHKSPSSVNKFKCPKCLFVAKHKGYLKCHLLSHRSPSEISIFKCEMCSYETKRKHHLKRHLLIHSASEINKFKCATCSYVGKRKSHLKRHVLIHGSPTDVNMSKA